MGSLGGAYCRRSGLTHPCFSATTTFSRLKNRADIATFAKSYFKHLRKEMSLMRKRQKGCVFRALYNKVEVCYDTEEWLIKLCGLDVYMDEVDSNSLTFIN